MKMWAKRRRLAIRLQQPEEIVYVVPPQYLESDLEADYSLRPESLAPYYAEHGFWQGEVFVAPARILDVRVEDFDE